MKRRDFVGMASAAAALGGLGARPAAAQDTVTLRLHQFLAPVATVPAKILKPWAAEVEEASGGRIKIEHFDAMALGGRPPELMDQARDGVVDLAMTLGGYTPGRFPRSEVFELPFMMTDPVATGRAYQQMIEEDFQSNEFADVKVLGGWVHGPGVVHTLDGVYKLEDMKGKQLRGPTRVINDLLSELGATPVGMPLPGIPEALSKGVINGTVIPWEVTPSIKLAELVKKHTEFKSKEALYTSTILLVMNKAKYESLPEDLRAIIDSKSGDHLSRFASQAIFDGDIPGRAIAVKLGNEITELDQAEVDRWKAAAKPVVDRWLADLKGQGIDGQALIDRATALIAEKSM
jgi:TRAP-type C4-dicarboxylate transport system substrate-binding protein